MNKEQLYDVFVMFKDSSRGPYRNKCAIEAEVVGLALVITQHYQHGVGKVIYSLDEIHSCSVVPLSDEDYDKVLQELGGN